MDTSYLSFLTPTKDTQDLPQVNLAQVDTLTLEYYGTTKLNKIRFKTIFELRGKNDIKKIYKNVERWVSINGQMYLSKDPQVETITHLDSPNFKDLGSIKLTLIYLWIIQNGEVGKEYIIEDILYGGTNNCNVITKIKLT